MELIKRFPGAQATCFISPIFPGITDVPAIIRRAKARFNLVWLENLNLGGSYKGIILDYIAEKHNLQTFFHPHSAL